MMNRFPLRAVGQLLLSALMVALVLPIVLIAAIWPEKV